MKKTVAALLAASALVACQDLPVSPTAAAPHAALAATSPRWTSVSLTPSPRPVPESYFGMHVHFAYSFASGRPETPWPSVGFGSLRMWDSGTAWLSLQPKPRHWHWVTLDSLVGHARRSGIAPVLTLGATPTWASSRPDEASPYAPGAAAPPADVATWRAYVDAVTKRYRGRLEAYEVWNEPNLTEFYTGTVEQLVTLARTARERIRANDPGALVVTPSVTGAYGVPWLDRYLAAGGGAEADVVGYHFYVRRAPEDIVPLADSVRRVMARHGVDKPIWNTEVGWYNENTQSVVSTNGGTRRVLTQSEAVAYTSRTLVLGWCAGLARTYWYAWDNAEMGLTDADHRTAKPAALAYETTRRWLTGATVGGCARSESGVWTVTLTRPDGAREAILWVEDGADAAAATAIASTSWCPAAELTSSRTPATLAVGAAPVLARPCASSTVATTGS